VKFWQSLAFTEADQLVELARIAEAVGFHGVMVSDHLFYPGKLDSRYPYSPDGHPGFTPDTPWPEPWSAIAAMAAVTTRLRFTTAVYILPLRHPLEVAKATATAAVLSGDRIALGIGSGWMKEEFDALGVDFATRGRRTDEMVEVLRKLWTGGMVEHHGKCFDFDRLQIAPAPSAPLPIWVGGASDAALRRAARLDGWIGAGDTRADLLAKLERLRALRSAAGRSHQPFESVCALVEPVAAGDLAALEDAGVGSLVSYPLAFTLGPRSSLEQKRAALERYAEQMIARAR
jgi:probable F420-dependent oxidoreductase